MSQIRILQSKYESAQTYQFGKYLFHRIVLRTNAADASSLSTEGSLASSVGESESSGANFGWSKDAKFDFGSADSNAKPGDVASKFQRYPSLGSPNNNHVSTPFYFNIG